MMKKKSSLLLGLLVLLSAFSLFAQEKSQTGFSMAITFANFGWEKNIKLKPVSYGNGYCFVRGSWKPYSKKRGRDVRYKAWIQSTASDWESADCQTIDSSGKKIWVQYAPVHSHNKSTGLRCKLSLGYRPGKGKLPEVFPLKPGVHKFELCVERIVANGKTELSTKPFEITIKPEKENNLILSGVADLQVFQRTSKTKGDIAFYLVNNKPKSDFKIIIKSKNKNIAQKMGRCSAKSTHIILKNIPVGGPYTVEVIVGKISKTLKNIYMGDLWIVSGQSNAVGCGKDTSLGKSHMPGVHCLTPSCDRWIWKVAKDGFFGANVGPWVAAAQEFYKGTGVPVGLMGHAVGGQPMDFFMDEQHKEMPFLKSRVEKHGAGAPLFMWYQGESDSFRPEVRGSYGKKLIAMAAAMRRYTQNPELKIGIVQLSKLLWYKDDHFAIIREFQREFVLNDKNSVLFSTIAYEVNNKDKIHLTSKGQIALGNQMGRTMIRKEKTDKLIAGPTPKSIKFNNKDKIQIIVKFNNGKGLKGGNSDKEWFVMDKSHQGFKKGGFVKISRITIQPEKESVFIELNKPAGAEATLSYGYRCDIGGTLVNQNGDPAIAFVAVTIK